MTQINAAVEDLSDNPVVRSGKPSDAVGLAAKFNKSLGCNDHVELVVLPDVNPTYDTIDYRHNTLPLGLALHALYGLIGGAIVVEILIGTGLLGSRLDPIALLVYAATVIPNIASAGYEDLKFYLTEMRVLRRLRNDNVKLRGYGLGHGKIHVVRVAQKDVLRKKYVITATFRVARVAVKNLIRETYVIDPSRSVKRSVDGDIANYQVPLQGGGTLTMLSLPLDSRIDGLLMRAPVEARNAVLNLSAA